MGISSPAHIIITTSMLMLGLIIILTVSFQATGRTITVEMDGHGDFRSIQDAINCSVDGDNIIVGNGELYDRLFVNKTIHLMGKGTDTTIINGGGREATIITISANNVHLKGFSIINSLDEAIHVGSNGNVIGNIIISGCGKGIVLLQSSDTIIHNNTLSETDHGIMLTESKNTTIEYNAVTNGTEGIHFSGSTSNVILGNRVTYNYHYGIYLENNSNGNAIQSNYCNGNRDRGILIVDDSVDTVIFENDCRGSYHGIETSSDDTGIIGNIVMNCNVGIGLYGADNAMVERNICRNNSQGINAGKLTHAHINHNALIGNRVGIYVWYNSEADRLLNTNDISDNEFNNNDYDIETSPDNSEMVTCSLCLFIPISLVIAAVLFFKVNKQNDFARRCIKLIIAVLLIILYIAFLYSWHL